MTVNRICSIRRRGYCLFDHAILCGFYLRAATNQEQRLLNSLLSVKSFVNVRGLRKASLLTKIYNVVTWFWSKPSSFLISRRFATKWCLHSTSNPFYRFLLPMTSHIDCPLCRKKCQTSLDSAHVLVNTVPIVYTFCMFWYCHSRHEVFSHKHMLLKY